LFSWGFYLVLSSFSAALLAYSAPTNPMDTKRVARSASSSAKAAALKAAAAGEDNTGDKQQVRIEITAAPVATNGAAYATNGDVELAPMDSLHQPAQKRLGGGALSSAKASFQLTSMPFTPATLSWRDLKYTVFVGKEKTPRVLLNHISGYAEPGKLIALMGSSGAGKTVRNLQNTAHDDCEMQHEPLDSRLSTAARSHAHSPLCLISFSIDPPLPFSFCPDSDGRYCRS